MSSTREYGRTGKSRELALQLQHLDRLLADLDRSPWCWLPSSEGWKHNLKLLQERLLIDLHNMENPEDRKN